MPCSIAPPAGSSASVWPGVPPMLLLDHVGAKSGTLRTTPLVYMRDADRFIVVAAKGGHPQNPACSTTCAHTPTRTSDRQAADRSARQRGRHRGAPDTLAESARLQPPTGAATSGEPAHDPAADPRTALSDTKPDRKAPGPWSPRNGGPVGRVTRCSSVEQSGSSLFFPMRDRALRVSRVLVVTSQRELPSWAMRARPVRVKLLRDPNT